MGGGVDAALAAMDATAQKRLLALAGDRANASRAIGEFLPFATSVLASRSDRSDNDVERAAGLRLLAQAFASRHATWTGSESLCSLERASGSTTGRRQAVVFAMKVAQSALKACAGATDKAGAAGVIALMDLACCALYVVWAFESDAPLGELTVDNLLYQVAKKYSEVQQTTAQASAACVLACTHVRLLDLHSTLCARDGQPRTEKSRFVALACETMLDTVVSTARLSWLVEFPAPAQLHSTQYTRLLLGVANTCVTLLFGARQYEGVYKAANDTLSRWIRHLDTSSAQDGKLATTLNDRIFRVLWKCASALEASPQFNGRIAESARFRALALSFMASCSTYQPLQIIQQVYRAGVQMERISKRREDDYKSVREFYMQSAIMLSQKRPESRHIYVSKKLDWEYLHWIEHFASVCENAQAAIDSAILLESAVHYVWRLGELGQAIGRCMCCVIAGNLLDLATRTHSKPASSADCEKCDDRLQQIASKVFAELMKPVSSGAAPSHHWEKAARMFLKKTSIAEECALEGASSQMQQLVPFVTRCLKRGSVKLYSFATASNLPVRSQLQAQISTSFDTFCSMLQLLRFDRKLDAKLLEFVILTESRLRRLGFGLIIRGYSGRSNAPRDALISKQVEKVQKLLDDVMALDTSATVMQTILMDLNMIARESYACAARFYQSKNYYGTLSALIGSFEVGESFLEYVMCSELSQEEIVKAHQQLKMDAIVSLLAFCYHEIGDVRHARIFSGHSILYCSDASGFSQTNIDKYVASILKECESRDEGVGEEFLVSEFKGFIDGIVSAFKARHCEDIQVVDVMHAFRRSFQRASDRTMLTLRARKEGDKGLDKQRAVDTVRMCIQCEHILDAITLQLADHGDEQSVNTLLGVCGAVAARKLCYSVYYVDQNAEIVIQGLLQTYATLTSAVEALQCSDHAVELGVVYGWRGVLSMEIMLASSYSGTPIPNAPAEAKTSAFNEDSTLCDFEKCLMHLTSATTTVLFSTDRVVYCLEAVCETLSLISCPELESTARNVLQHFQSSTPHADSAAVVGPPPSFDLVETCEQADEDVVMDDDVRGSLVAVNDENVTIAQLFQMVDEDIAYAFSLQDDVQQACRRVRRAASSLSAIKSKARTERPSADVTKAAEMRQMILHLALSDICFAQGKTDSAFTDAKAALAISWKLSKRFASHLSLDESFHFKLPLELSNDGKSDGHDDSSALLYFKALEFSSWDILTGAKVALCRIATLYRSTGQPRRAATYYTEAMRLVGGLCLSLFNRDPFCQYAQLQLKSNRLQQARIALGLMPDCLPTNPLDETHRMSDDGPPRSQELDARSRFRRQQCIELIQEGDLARAEGDLTAAHGLYTTAIKMLTEATEARATANVFRTLRARCWRKLVKLQAEATARHKTGDHGNSDFEELVVAMKELKTALDDCFDPVERVKCLLELGRHILTLALVAESPSTELSLDEAIRLLENAFVRGNGFGIQHLSKELRVALGSAYHMQLEILTGQVTGLAREDSSRVRFLSQASSILLANSSSVEVTTDASQSEADSDSSAEDYFSAKLDELVIQREQSQEEQPRAQVEKYVEDAVEQMKHLPASWLTVSITVGVSSELLLTRFSADDSPTTFRLVGVQWKEIVSELQAIVEESRVTLSGHSAEEAGAWSSEQKKRWWDTRKQLDTQMGNTIVKMQTALGFWRCLLVKGSTTSASHVAQQCWTILLTPSNNVCEKRLQTLLCAMVDSLAWLSDIEVHQGLQFIAQQLGVAVSPSDISRACQLLRDAASGSDEVFDQRAEPDPLSKTQLLSTISSEAIQKMKVSEMKELLSAVGLSTSGLKKDLLDRLLAARDDFNRSQSQSRHGNHAEHPSSKHLEGSTVVILDRCLLEFPWEGIDVLSACSGVTRMPSLDLIVKNASRCFSSSADASWRVDRRRVRYVLNPSGDLKATQKQLGPILEQNAGALGWEGIVGCAPDPQEFRRFLEESDLLIYCGHGSGEKYLHRDKIRGIESGCSAALLFGCSSGRLESEGVFGPDGAVLSYLRAGSPGVLAMLWDVTDKDIDQLSVRVLQQWLLPSEEDQDAGEINKALAHVVQAARGACKLRYLNGHAAVCYGLPLHVSTDD